MKNLLGKKLIWTRLLAMVLAFVTLFSSLPANYAMAASSANEIEYGDDYVILNGKKYTKTQFEKILKESKGEELGDLADDESGYIKDILTISGVGMVILTYTDEIFIVKQHVKKGSWVYTKILNKIKQQQAAERALKRIPPRLRSKDNVKISLFNVKRGNSKYESRGWSITKVSGKAQWILKNKAGRRAALLNISGKVIGE